MRIEESEGKVSKVADCDGLREKEMVNPKSRLVEEDVISSIDNIKKNLA